MLEPELLEPEFPLGALFRWPDSLLGALIFGADCDLGSEYPLGLSVFGELVLGSEYVLGFSALGVLTLGALFLGSEKVLGFSVFGPLFLGELVLGSTLTSFCLGFVDLGVELFLGFVTSVSLVLGVDVVPLVPPVLGSLLAISFLPLGVLTGLLLSKS